MSVRLKFPLCGSWDFWISFVIQKILRCRSSWQTWTLQLVICFCHLVSVSEFTVVKEERKFQGVYLSVMLVFWFWFKYRQKCSCSALFHKPYQYFSVSRISEPLNFGRSNKLMMESAKTVILGSGPRGTHDNVFLSYHSESWDKYGIFRSIGSVGWTAAGLRQYSHSLFWAPQDSWPYFSVFRL
jgi:hypothetical protein